MKIIMKGIFDIDEDWWMEETWERISAEKEHLQRAVTLKRGALAIGFKDHRRQILSYKDSLVQLGGLWELCQTNLLPWYIISKLHGPDLADGNIYFCFYK